MSEALSKVKSLLVGSLDSVKQGNRDIAMNMMEIALDEMSSMEVEDLVDGLVVQTIHSNDPAPEEAFENQVFEDDMPEETARAGLFSIVSKMVADTKVS